MGHAKDTTMLGVYAHVLNTDDHTIVPVDGEEVTVFPTRFSDWMASHTPSATS